MTKNKIEEINIEESLFKVTRPEGTIIKRGEDYWIYVIDYECCEECGRDEEHKGWNRITEVIKKAKQEEAEKWHNQLRDLQKHETKRVIKAKQESEREIKGYKSEINLYKVLVKKYKKITDDYLKLLKKHNIK